MKGQTMSNLTVQNDVQNDVQVTNCGTIMLFQPLTQAAFQWIDENVSNEAQYHGSALAVESRYARDIAQGMLNDGLDVV